MRIAVVGAGALGLYYGAMLQKAGNDIRFLLRSDYKAMLSEGLTVYSVNGNFHLPTIKGYRTPAEIGYVDLVLVGLKTFANQYFKDLITPLVGTQTLILTMQNGLGNEESLADLFGAEKILGGIAFLCANRGKPGTVHHLAEGKILLGTLLPSQAEHAELVATIFVSSGLACRVVHDLKKARWEKLVWNIPFNGLCSLLKVPVDLILNQEATRRLTADLMHEVIEGANAQQLSREIPFSLADNMIVSTSKLGSYKPSMLIDRLEKRPLELEAIFAVPLSAAEKHGISMPRVQMLYALLQHEETG